MSNKDNFETASGFRLDDVRAGLQAICDARGFTLVEDVEYEKCNGKYTSALFDVRVNYGDTAVRVTAEDKDTVIASHHMWLNSDDELFSDDVIRRIEAESLWLSKVCDNVLASILGNKIHVIGHDDWDLPPIPMATSSSELKLKLELMS